MTGTGRPRAGCKSRCPPNRDDERGPDRQPTDRAEHAELRGKPRVEGIGILPRRFGVKEREPDLRTEKPHDGMNAATLKANLAEPHPDKLGSKRKSEEL